MGKHHDKMNFDRTVFDDWLDKNPLPDRFRGSDFDPVPVPQLNERLTATSLLRSMEEDGESGDAEPARLHYRSPRWWVFAYAGALITLAVLVARFVKELP